MNIDNTQSQMRKGVLEFCILSIIKQGEAYPSDIIEKMKEAKLDILEGTLYPLLTRLKNAELLTYRWVESSSGPPRKYFSMTEKGEAFYLDLEATWNELANAVKPVVLPGEEMHVHLIQEGKELGQGVAYLDDGTMVVVDNARKMISKTIEIVVTSVLQTTAGKMIFGRYIESTVGPQPVGPQSLAEREREEARRVRATPQA